jgi:epoxyqueuosine reductase
MRSASISVGSPLLTAFPMQKIAAGEFIDAGRHGTMEWMAETRERRGDPRTLWSDVKSDRRLRAELRARRGPARHSRQARQGAISVYARNRDYHDVIKGRLKEIAGKIAARAGADVKVFVDTAPVMEKPLAAAAGLGWQGKHTNLVSREHGSWLFLGSIFTTAELVPDRPRSTIAAPAAPVSTPARPTPSRRPTSSMRGAASPISPSSTRGRSTANSGR